MGIQDMMKQAQEMQERLQREMSTLTVQATAGTCVTASATVDPGPVAAPAAVPDFSSRLVERALGLVPA